MDSPIDDEKWRVPTTSKSARDGSAHYTDLDGMRGVLACVVMLFHYGLSTLVARSTAGSFQSGAWGLSVDFFFILSGFVLSKSFGRRRQEVKSYLIKRVARLAPVFYLSTFVMLAFKFQMTDAATIVANLCMMQSFIGYESINFPAWSIPFELVLPLVALLFWTLVERQAKYLALISLLGGMASAYMFVTGTDAPLLRAASGLGLGFGLALIPSPVRGLSVRPAVVCFLFTGILLIMLTGEKWPYLTTLFHPIAALTILCGAQTRSIFSQALFQSLGRWSYSIYLLHEPVLSCAVLLLGDEQVRGNLPVKMLCVITTIVCARMVYVWIEMPALKFGTRQAR